MLFLFLLDEISIVEVFRKVVRSAEPNECKHKTTCQNYGEP